MIRNFAPAGHCQDPPDPANTREVVLSNSAPITDRGLSVDDRVRHTNASRTPGRTTGTIRRTKAAEDGATIFEVEWDGGSFEWCWANELDRL